jgi:predicted HicB family RNase H-like nuclease
MPNRKRKDAPIRRLFGLRLNEELITELRHAALDKKIPPNQLMEEAIEEWLKQNRRNRKEQD